MPGTVRTSIIAALLAVGVAIAAVLAWWGVDASSGPQAGGSPSPIVSTSSTPTPTSSAKGCLAKPSTCGYPDASNTGSHGTLTVHAGKYVTSHDGEVVKNLEIQGCLQVVTANVVIDNVQIDGGCLWSLDMQNATGPTTVTDTTVKAGSGQLAAVVMRGTTLLRVQIIGGQDGIEAWGGIGPNVVRDSYVHNLSRNDAIDSHDDAIQTSGGDETFTHNTLLPFDGTDPMNSCLQIGDLQGNLSRLTFSNNLCDGGNYSINANANNVKAGKVTAGPMTFSGNRFGQDYRYGVKANLDAPFTVTWSGNLDDASGKGI
jgi:hypothetical protein